MKMKKRLLKRLMKHMVRENPRVAPHHKQLLHPGRGRGNESTVEISRPRSLEASGRFGVMTVASGKSTVLKLSIAPAIKGMRCGTKEMRCGRPELER